MNQIQITEIRRALAKHAQAVHKGKEEHIKAAEDSIITCVINMGKYAAKDVHAYVESLQHEGNGTFDHKVVKEYIENKLVPFIEEVPDHSSGKF